MAKLKTYTKEELLNAVSIRNAETKWIQNIQIASADWKKEIQNTNIDFIILGVSEDIGIRANLGRAGAQFTFEKTLPTLLSIQANKYFDAKNALLLGNILFDEEYKDISTLDVDSLRKLCERVDDIVYEVSLEVFKTNKRLIVIGGGHNNSYPLLKALSSSLQKPVNCINVDAHTDYRIIEGRHSGNGFRYAKNEGYLKRYGIFGLHENYNSDNVLKEIDSDKDIQYICFEDVEVRKRYPIDLALNSLINFLLSDECGFEIDLDAIAHVPSSAMSATGFSLNDARAIVHQVSALLNTKYLHITEGSIGLAEKNDSYLLQKTIAYLISDYLKSSKNSR